MLINWLDPVGAGLSLICTYYFAQAHRSAWLIGVAAILVNTFLYWLKGLYGSVFLEIIYFASMIYGFIHWGPTKIQSVRPIRYLNLKEIARFSLLTCGLISLAAFILRTMTDSDVPYWDAATTGLSLMAQWLLCRKIMQCWIIWFIVDAMLIGLQCYKGIPFHAAIHGLYLFLAVLGYYRWHKLYIQTQAPSVLTAS